MRTREEIQTEANNKEEDTLGTMAGYYSRYCLEVLLDIRDELIKLNKRSKR